MTRHWSAMILCAALVSGCASGLGRPNVRTEAVTDARGVQVVDIDMHSFYFEPNKIVVHVGRPVELKLRNRSIIVPHNFTISDPSLRVSANKWGFGAHHVRFIPVETGEFKFYCHVDAHGKKKGMTGTLVVVP